MSPSCRLDRTQAPSFHDAACRCRHRPPCQGVRGWSQHCALIVRVESWFLIRVLTEEVNCGPASCFRYAPQPVGLLLVVAFAPTSIWSLVKDRFSIVVRCDAQPPMASSSASLAASVVVSRRQLAILAALVAASLVVVNVFDPFHLRAAPTRQTATPFPDASDDMLARRTARSAVGGASPSLEVKELPTKEGATAGENAPGDAAPDDAVPGASSGGAGDGTGGSQGSAPTIAKLPLSSCEVGGVAQEHGFDGLRRFHKKCLKADTNRIEVVSPPSTGEGIRWHRGPGFLLRDVCALGHYPKELTHLHTYMERQRRRGGISADGNNISLGGTDRGLRRRQEGNPSSAVVDEGPLLPSHFIIGHRCATRDPRHISNSRTRAFHNIFADWTAAILDLPSKVTVLGDRERFIYWSDVQEQASASKGLICFDLLLEREEHWRWFPGTALASSFRRKLWKYFAVEGAVQARDEEMLSVPFVKQRKANVLILRRDEDRHFDEPQAAAFIQARFGSVANVSFEQWDSLKSVRSGTVAARGGPRYSFDYRDQVRSLVDADIFITAHGAALSSVVFMRPGTVVIELFPHHFRYAMYEELAEVMQLDYVPFEGRVVAPTGCCKGRDIQDVAPAGAAAEGGRSSRDVNMERVIDMNGNRKCKKCDIAVSGTDLFYLMKDALASLWLHRSRFTTVHGFDKRRER